MTNVNKETGIRYGVIDARDVPLLTDEIFSNGINDSYEAWKEDCIKELEGSLPDWATQGMRAYDVAENIFNSLEVEYQEEEDNYSYDDGEGNQFLLSYLGGAPLIWCIKTTRIVFANKLCSPCVPNAGDLNSGIDEKTVVTGHECYGVPLDYMGDID